MGGDSRSEGRGFKSRCCIQDGHKILSHKFAVRTVMFVWKDENKRKRGRGWHIFWIKTDTCQPHGANSNDIPRDQRDSIRNSFYYESRRTDVPPRQNSFFHSLNGTNHVKGKGNDNNNLTTSGFVLIITSLVNSCQTASQPTCPPASLPVVPWWTSSWTCDTINSWECARHRSVAHNFAQQFTLSLGNWRTPIGVVWAIGKNNF